MIPALLVPIGLAIAREVAPHLVGLIAGKGGEKVAERVIDAAAREVGAKPETFEDGAKLVQAVQDNPEVRATLKVRLARLEIERERLAVEDRKSARARQVQIAQAGRRDVMPAVVAVAVFVLLGMTLGVIVYVDIPAEKRELSLIIVTALLSNVGAVVQFYFGSSAGSKQKTDAINAGLSRAVVPPADTDLDEEGAYRPRRRRTFAQQLRAGRLP